MPVHAPGARVVDLGHTLRPGMPQSRQAPAYRHELAVTHGERERPDGVSIATDLLTTGTHVGTHIDAIAHAALHGRLHGGVLASRAQSSGRFEVGGAEQIPAMVCRGVLVDAASMLGVDSCPPDFVVDAAFLARAERESGAIVAAGDVVLVRVGWEAKFGDADQFLGVGTGLPGVDASAAEWLAERGVIAAGSDTIAFELVPPDSGQAPLPVHRILLAEHGIHIIESLTLDELAATGATTFTFILAPLKLEGATASPVRPLAILA